MVEVAAPALRRRRRPSRSQQSPLRWRASRHLHCSTTSNELLIRHSSWPDRGHIGVLIPPRSLAPALIAYLRMPRTRQEIRARFPAPDLDETLRVLAINGIVFPSRAAEYTFELEGYARSISRDLETVARHAIALGPML